MIDGVIDRVDAFAAAWRIPLAVFSAAWFAATCADYAGFIDVPAFPLLTGMPGIMIAGAWNAIWWGMIYPRAEQRRALRMTEGKQDG